MFNIFANILAGYVLIGVAISLIWFIHGLIVSKEPNPIRNLDFFMAALIMGLVCIGWGPLALVALCDLYRRLRYGDCRGAAAKAEPFMPYRQPKPQEREVDEHESHPGI